MDLHILTKASSYSPLVGTLTAEHGLDPTDPQIEDVEKIANELNPIDAREFKIDAFCCHLRKHAQSYIDEFQPAIDAYEQRYSDLEKQAFTPFKTTWDHVSEAGGGGLQGGALAFGANMTPYLGTAMAAGDTLINGANMFASDIGWKDRLGYGALAAANGLGTAAGVMSGGFLGGPVAAFLTKILGKAPKFFKGTQAAGKAIAHGSKLGKGFKAGTKGMGIVDDLATGGAKTVLKHGDMITGTGHYAHVGNIQYVDDVADIARLQGKGQKIFATMKGDKFRIIDTRKAKDVWSASGKANKGLFQKVRDFNRWTGDTAGYSPIRTSQSSSFGRRMYDKSVRFMDKETNLAKGWNKDLAAKGWNKGSYNPFGFVGNTYKAYDKYGFKEGTKLLGKRVGTYAAESPTLAMFAAPMALPAPYYMGNQLIKSDTPMGIAPNPGAMRSNVAGLNRGSYLNRAGHLGGLGYNLNRRAPSHYKPKIWGDN